MIFGIGTDIVQISRINTAVEKKNSRFPEKILTLQEYAVYQERYSQSSEKGIRYLSTRFAAKEAFSKAMGIGFRDPMAWHSIEIINDKLGCPQVILSSTLLIWTQDRNISVCISLADEKEYAIAYVILEQKNNHV